MFGEMCMQLIIILMCIIHVLVSPRDVLLRRPGTIGSTKYNSANLFSLFIQNCCHSESYAILLYHVQKLNLSKCYVFQTAVKLKQKKIKVRAAVFKKSRKHCDNFQKQISGLRYFNPYDFFIILNKYYFDLDAT